MHGMENNDLDARRQQIVGRLKFLVAEVERHGFSASRLAVAAGLPPSTINRKLTGQDQSLMKAVTLARIEEAASTLTGKPHASREALMAELDATNEEIAHSLDDLVRTLVAKGILSEADLPPSLRRAVSRRRNLLEILGLAE